MTTTTCSPGIPNRISIEVTVALTHMCLSSHFYAEYGGLNFIYVIIHEKTMHNALKNI